VGKSPLGYIRKRSIKSLYNPETFLGEFNTVKFTSVLAFSNAVKGGFYSPKEELWIHIHSKEDFNSLKKIIEGSSIDTMCQLYIVIYDNDLFKHFEGMENRKFRVIAADGYDGKGYINYSPYLKYRTNNAIYTPIEINYHNVDTIFDDIIDMFMTQKNRLFWLTFDYISFEKHAKFSDIHRLFFRINRFISWSMSSKDLPMSMKRSSKRERVHHQGLEYQFYGGRLTKPILVDEELKLWYNERHRKEQKIPSLFQLVSDKTGEDIPFKELNLIRQYIDLPLIAIINRLDRNLTFIDFYQNLLIQKVINEVPFITELISRWIIS